MTCIFFSYLKRYFYTFKGGDRIWKSLKRVCAPHWITVWLARWICISGNYNFTLKSLKQEVQKSRNLEFYEYPYRLWLSHTIDENFSAKYTVNCKTWPSILRSIKIRPYKKISCFPSQRALVLESASRKILFFISLNLMYLALQLIVFQWKQIHFVLYLNKK